VTRVRGTEVWGVPGFRRYFLGRTISSFGSSFGVLALTFAVLGATGSAADLGIVLGASAVPALLLMLIGGVVGDRVERRRILVSTDLVMGGAQLAAAACFAFGLDSILLIAGLQVVRGAASAFFNPASTGMLPTVVPPEHVQSANAVLGMARNVSGIVGPAAAGVVIATTSPAVALAVDAATYLVSALFLWTLPRSRGRVQADMKVHDDVREGWREFSSRAWVWQMVGSLAIYQATVLPAIYLVGPTLASSDGGDGAAGWAVVLSARAVGSLLVGFVLVTWRPARPLVASTVLIMLDVPFLAALALDAPLWLLAVTGAFSAAGIVCADTLWESELQTRIPEEAISRVSSYDWLGSLSMNPIGNVVVGIAISQAGAKEIVLSVLAVTVLVHGLLLLSPAIRARPPLTT